MTEKPFIILVGGGGHCRSVIDVIESEGKYKIKGIIDTPDKIGEKILDYKVIGNDSDIFNLAKKFKNFCITVGQIDSPNIRIKLFHTIRKAGGKLPIITSPTAYVSRHSKIEASTIIMHNAVINANTTIGKNCIINTNSLIEHDCKISDNCHISTNAIINGGVKIGSNCFIGSNSVTIQYISINNNAIIGAGAVVTKNISEIGVYVGNPARQIKSYE